MPLSQLIYISSATGETLANIEHELRDILEVSVRNNRQQGLTGMLLYSNGGFMQVLEGEEEALQAAYGRIAADPRHKDLYLLAHEPVAVRAFSQWHLGCRRLDLQGLRGLAVPADFAPFVRQGFDERALQARPGVALEMLRHYSVNNGLAQRQA
ncbi:BLUF domain-containing protein [Azohydromonas aeria]|uniref:BLUF domain-containing protein n=1 Tax=Azohydromonas aeria TaxID=2590212 RepID=UPI0012FB2DDE|nr:BLUF domain-containing protein [Azohydromonas aeria]